MTPPIRRLRKHLEAVPADDSPMFDSWMSRAFQLVRVLIESTDSKRDYPTLKFFADWLFHDALDQAGARTVLNSLEDVLSPVRLPDMLRDIASNPAAGSYDPFIVAINEKLSTARLRADWLRIVEAHQLARTPFVSFGTWRELTRTMVDDLLEKPLGTGKPLSDAQADLEAAVRGHMPLVARQLTLSEKEINGKHAVWLEIRTHQRLVLNVEYAVSEPREAFEVD
jgi:hypothetical protein